MPEDEYRELTDHEMLVKIHNALFVSNGRSSIMDRLNRLESFQKAIAWGLTVVGGAMMLYFVNALLNLPRP